MSNGLDIGLERIKLKLIKPPSRDLQCVERYAVPSVQKPLYRVCITKNGSYVVYDAVVEDPEVLKKVSRVEEELYDVLVGEESLPDFLSRLGMRG